MKINSNFIPDEQKLNLTSGDLFDRIINLKLTCADEQGKVESFVIRSDYELIWGENFAHDFTPKDVGLKCQIRRCTHKPSIKLQYKMTTSSFGTQIDVYVANFFLLTKDGKHLRSFNSSNYKILFVEIAMGYWGQFRLGKESDYAVPSYEDYFKIQAKNGAKQ